MGSPASRGAALRFGCPAVAVFWASLAPAQVPTPGPQAEPPPLDPPPSQPPATGPSFLKSQDDVEAARRDRADREQRAFRERPAPDAPYTGGPPALPRDFVLSATPWVDFSLTNFWMDNRVSNFLNIGVQVGGYFFDRMRLTARLVAPMQQVTDEQYGGYYSSGGGFPGYIDVRSRSVAVLYGASVGLIISNSKSFLFAPGALLMRTDVEDYGTSLALSLPFEWTTRRHLRIGFELALGQAMGGTQADTNGGTEERQSGTFVLLQFAMGYSMGGP